MLFKILLWAVVGYIVYSWFQDKFKLKQGENKTTIHHHHYKDGKKRGKGDDEDYIEFEDLNK